MIKSFTVFFELGKQELKKDMNVITLVSMSINQNKNKT